MTTFSADDRQRLDLDAAREEIRHLHRALFTRPVIDQAKGMLMAQHRCTADDAFRMLVAASQRTNRAVSELARSIVEHAAGPPCPRVVDPSGGQPREQGADSDPVDIKSVLAQALARDQRAERRDRDAETRDLAARCRPPGGPDGSCAAAADRQQAAIDRVLSGADRDASAVDRAELLRSREGPPPERV